MQEGIEVQCDAPFTLTGHHVCNIRGTVKEKDTDKEKEEPLYEMRDANQEYYSLPLPLRSHLADRLIIWSCGRGGGPAPMEQEEVEAREIPDDQVTKLEGHTSEVFICSWSPTGPLLASG